MQVITDVLERHEYVKINMTVNMLFERHGATYQHVHTTTPPYVAVAGDLAVPQLALEHLCKNTEDHVDGFNPLASGSELLGVYNVKLEFAHFEPLLGGCCGACRLPKSVVDKKACVSVKNDRGDRDCFKWAVLSVLHPASDHVDRLSKYRPFEDMYDWSCIRFPTALTQIQRFEAANNIRVNVYGFEERVVEGKKTAVPFLLRHSKHLDESWLEANVLLHDGHYFGIKSMSRLLNSQDVRHNHLCTRCLKVCKSAALLASHKQQCLAVKPVAVKMPDGERAVVGFRKFHALAAAD